MAKKQTESGKSPMAAILKLDRSGLLKELNESRRDLFLLNMKKASGELKETHQVVLQKKKVARVLTALTALKN